MAQSLPAEGRNGHRASGDGLRGLPRRNATTESLPPVNSATRLCMRCRATITSALPALAPGRGRRFGGRGRIAPLFRLLRGLVCSTPCRGSATAPQIPAASSAPGGHSSGDSRRPWVAPGGAGRNSRRRRQTSSRGRYPRSHAALRPPERRGRDSNPRSALTTHNGFRDRALENGLVEPIRGRARHPLRHLPIRELSRPP